MKNSDLLLIILGVALLIGMLLTALLGRGSRHGYGAAPPCTAPVQARQAGVGAPTHT